MTDTANGGPTSKRGVKMTEPKTNEAAMTAGLTESLDPGNAGDHPAEPAHLYADRTSAVQRRSPTRRGSYFDGTGGGVVFPEKKPTHRSDTTRSVRARGGKV